MSPPEAPPAADRVTRGAIAVLALAAVLLIASPVFRATLMLEQVNEGWDGGHALNAFSPALYPTKPALILNNYPPLWFYLTGWLARVFGDPIFPGRWVAFAAYAAVAAEIFILCRRLGVGVAASLVGALGFLVTVEAFYAQWVGLAEPQMLAHAFATGAVALLVGARSKAAARIAALVTVAALMVKQVVVGLPIACTLWLLLRRRSLAFTWISTGAVAAVAAVVTLLLAYGGPLLENVFAPRYLTWERFGTNMALVQRPIVSVIAFAVTAFLLRRRWDEPMLFAALAIGAAFIPMAVFGSALGVSINIGLDLAIAASIGLAVAWERAEPAIGDARYVGLWRGLLTATLLLLVAVQLPRNRNGALDVFEPSARSRLIATSTALRNLRDRIAGLKDPVVCETLAVCVWAKHPTEADLWKLRHERTLAFLDARPLVAQVDAGGYAAVTTLGPATYDGVQTPGLTAALARSYQPPILFAGTALYLPKRAP